VVIDGWLDPRVFMLTHLSIHVFVFILLAEFRIKTNFSLAGPDGVSRPDRLIKIPGDYHMYHKNKPKLSYLTQTQEVAMILSRFLRDVDALKLLLKQWVLSEVAWNRDFYIQLHRCHNEEPRGELRMNRHFMLFDIQHFYPKFLASLNHTSRSYEDMPIRDKVRLLRRLNADKDTISMRRKSIYLFQRNRVDESRTYPVDYMVHQNSSDYLVGIVSYRGSFG
jgi:hypothetical protein